MNKTKISVAGAGCVGLSIATLLAQNNQVTLVGVVPDNVEKVNARISPIQDEYIEKCPMEMNSLDRKLLTTWPNSRRKATLSLPTDMILA